MASVNVFMSHSHVNRDVATDLQRVLVANQADVFLDQDEIEAGDALPERLTEGIEWCNRFLLLWSAAASRSSWVQQEWDFAYGLKKKIIPYVLDSAPLPEVLESLVYVDLQDRQLGNANLLTAVFGKTFKPADSTELFPGPWRARLAIAGLGDACYDIELRKNGQLTGSGSMGRSGLFAQLAIQSGLGHLLNMPIPLRGRWTYDDGSRNLMLDITADALGQSQQEVINIITTGKESGALRGKDLLGRPWIVERRGGSEPVNPKPLRVIGGGSYLDWMKK